MTLLHIWDLSKTNLCLTEYEMFIDVLFPSGILGHIDTALVSFDKN